MDRDGAAADNSYKWKSKYGSLVVTMYERVSMSGVNERGLSSHVLWLDGTKVAPRDPKKPGPSISMWMQWYLDNFATVQEAVDATKNPAFQLRMGVDPDGTPGLFHISNVFDGRINISETRRPTSRARAR